MEPNYNDHSQPKHMGTSKYGFRSLGIYLGLGAVMSLSLLMTVSLLFVREQRTVASQAKEMYIESTSYPGPSLTSTPTPTPWLERPTNYPYPEPTTGFADCGSYKLGMNSWGERNSCRNDLRIWCYNSDPAIPYELGDMCYTVIPVNGPKYVHCAGTVCQSDESARKIVNRICCPQLINLTDTPIYTPAPPGRGWPQ